MRRTVILVFLLVFGLLSCGLLLNQSLWLDEATSVLAARDLTVAQIVTRFSPNDFHPPLYYVLLRFWIKLGGDSEVWVRFLSVLATFTTSFVVYKVGRMLMERKWALVAAVLFATGPLVFYYSSEARMYALATLLVSTSFLAFFHLLEKFERRWWIGWAISLTLLVYTDYMPFLVLPVFLLPLVWGKLTKKAVVLGMAVPGVFFFLWLPSFLHQLTLGAGVQASSPGWSAILGSFNFKSVPLLWVKLLIGRISFYNKVVYGGIVALVSLAFGYPLWQSLRGSTPKKGSNIRIYLWLWLTVPVILGFLLSLRLSVFQYFRFLFIVPAFYLLVALGVRRLGRVAAIVALSLNVAFIGYYLQTSRFYREDWRSTAAYIKGNLKSSAIALFPNAGQADPYRYYGEPASVADPKTWAQDSPVQVWLFRYVQEIFDPKDSLRKRLESGGYRKIEEKAFNQVLVWRYELP